MAKTPPDGRFAVILPSLNGYPLEEIRDKIAELFSVLKSTAARIIQSAPIVLLEDATPEEAEHIRRLLGIELTIQPAVQLNGQLPKLAWPRRPSINIQAERKAGYENAARGAEFGDVQYVENSDKVRQIRFRESGKSSTATTTASAPVKAAPKPAAPNHEHDSNGEPKPAYGNGRDANDIFTYNLFLAKVTSEGKRLRAIELISKVRGVSALEAEEIMERTIVPIIKGVTKKEADEIQAMFKHDRIAVQVLKKPK